jgi:hypothetical protein
MYTTFRSGWSLRSGSKRRADAPGLATLLPGRRTVLPMIKGVAIAALVLAAASLADQQLSYGRYTDAALKLVREIDHSFRR